MFYHMRNRNDSGWIFLTTIGNPFLMKLSILDFIMTVMCFTSYVESWVQELTRYLRTQAHIYLWFRNNYWNIALISLLGIRSYWTKIAKHIIMSSMTSSSNSPECNAEFFLYYRIESPASPCNECLVPMYTILVTRHLFTHTIVIRP